MHYWVIITCNRFKYIFDHPDFTISFYGIFINSIGLQKVKYHWRWCITADSRAIEKQQQEKNVQTKIEFL